LNLVFGRDAEVAEWVAQRVGYKIWPPYVAIGATKDGQTYCSGVVFNNWNGANIEITLASDNGLSRGAIRGIYYYLFSEVAAVRVTAHTRRSNKRMRKILPRLGFQYEGLAKRFYGLNKADDAFVFVLFPENASKYHERRRITTPGT
jgi:RimJ/RimL family protein N-acetyltransferase